MKNILLLTLCLALSPIAFAESPVEREIAQLREQRDKAVAEATVPINRRYQASLEQILRREMQVNDLDGALKIKAALSELGVATTPGEAARSPLQALLEGSRWEWFNAAEPKGKPANWVEFYKDGSGQSGWNQTLRYTITGPNTVTVTQGGPGTTWFLIVDIAKKLARYDPEAGAGHDQRSMKFEKRISSTIPNSK